MRARHTQYACVTCRVFPQLNLQIISKNFPGYSSPSIAQRFDFDLPNELIEDFDQPSSLLQLSEESDSLDDLVIKDFAIHVVQSEPDPDIESLPIADQVLIESNKLQEMIESVKERFQMKVAQYKRNEKAPSPLRKPNFELASPLRSPKSISSSRNAQPVYGQANHARHEMLPEINTVSPRQTVPVPHILDSENYGSVALPKPLLGFGESEPGNTSSEEDFLKETEMRFDDVFGEENVLAPLRTTAPRPAVKTSPQRQKHKMLSSNQRITEQLPDFGGIEDLESPHFTDLSSDESIQRTPAGNLTGTRTAPPHAATNHSVDVRKTPPPMAFNTTPQRHKNTTTTEQLADYVGIEDLESPHFTDQSSDESIQRTPPPSTNQQAHTAPRSYTTDFIPKTQHEKDIRKLKELIDSGALNEAMTNQRFEEGVLDLLLRQSDSLWDPIVGGIPITYFIPSQNRELGLLDTSVDETNLVPPLAKAVGGKKLPDFMTALENEWTSRGQQNEEPPEVVEDAEEEAVDNVVVEDENALVRGLPQFSYEPRTRPVRQKKILNLIDNSLPEDSSDEILSDGEMNFEDFTSNAAAPSYDFQLGKAMDDLEIKAQILRRIAEKNELMKRQKDEQIRKLTQPTSTGDQPLPAPVNVRKSVSFADSISAEDPRNESFSRHALSPSEDDQARTWTTLDIAEVNRAIEYAKAAQSKYLAQLQAKKQTKGRRSSTATKITEPTRPKDISTQEKGGANSRDASPANRKHTQSLDGDETVQWWSSLGIDDVKRSLEYARLAQAKYQARNQSKPSVAPQTKPQTKPRSSVVKEVPKVDQPSKSESEVKRSENKRSVTTDTTQSQSPGGGNDVERWTTLGISEVKEMLEYARLAQARHKNATVGKSTTDQKKRRR